MLNRISTKLDSPIRSSNDRFFEQSVCFIELSAVYSVHKWVNSTITDELLSLVLVLLELIFVSDGSFEVVAIIFDAVIPFIYLI